MTWLAVEMKLFYKIHIKYIFSEINFSDKNLNLPIEQASKNQINICNFKLIKLMLYLAIRLATLENCQRTYNISNTIFPNQLVKQ